MKKALLLVIIFLTSPLAVLAASSFSLNINLGGDTSTTTSSGGWSASALSATGLPSGSIMGIIINLMYWLLGLLGIFGVIGFVISGILYLVSTGDDEMLKRAKKSMTWSFVGVIVGLLGVVVIQAISFMLSGVSGF
jgi:hypothetical protein